MQEKEEAKNNNQEENSKAENGEKEGRNIWNCFQVQKEEEK